MAKQLSQENDEAGRETRLPPAFDAAHYLAANPDLDLTAEAAADHYARIGRAEGRVASPLALRENLIALIADGRPVLEIGPFCDPLLRGPNIAYLDILDADQLRARATAIGRNPDRCPEQIDYVGGLEQVDRRFDAVISSHAIEHQPDLVHHLQQVERILAPDGLFCLIIPDKRYCFDHHIAESTIADVLQAHHEQRRLHTLSSVLEHVALTTHNDPHRHWAGDHGPAIPADQPRRLQRVMRDYGVSAGRYIDVHAWYFTPDRFRTIIEALGALDLTGFEIAGVYDPARDRNEFCAVLRLSPAACERAMANADERGIVLLQTSDAAVYAPMLAVTATNVREYARRHRYGYDSFVGIKRGVHPWQATFNRIPMLAELLDSGFTGWALYLDADAYVQDLDFDLEAYLADKQAYAAIFATSGVTGEAWDVNAGVALVNLGHEQGRALVRSWARRFAMHSDETLLDAVEWMGGGNDQDLLHDLLREETQIAAEVLVVPMTFMNGPHASFVRQQLRTMAPTLQARLENLTEAVAGILGGGGGVVVTARPTVTAGSDGRWAARLAHAEGRTPALIEAPVPPPRLDLAERACALWAAARIDPEASPGHQRDFAAALDRGDLTAVAAELAALGKAQVAQGMLGGARQHERAQEQLFAERLARWTYDKLVSLAEAVGALPLENPEAGRLGGNAQADPAELFASIERVLSADLGPPAHIGGQLGIRVGEGRIIHMRMIDSIYAAWALRQLADRLGIGDSARIAEIGAGLGLTAFYARRLGLTNYRLYDRAATGAIEAYMLMGAGIDVSLPGEPPKNAAILDIRDFGAAKPGSIDLLLNIDSLPGFDLGEAVAHLAEARRLGIGHFLSINQEASFPGQTPVAELARRAGGYRLVSRHRHWLRAGYAEECYARVPNVLIWPAAPTSPESGVSDE